MNGLFGSAILLRMSPYILGGRCSRRRSRAAPLAGVLRDLSPQLGWTQRRARTRSDSPGGGTLRATVTPYSPARSRSSAEARSASAAIVSDGFTHNDVGTEEASVTK